MSGGSGEESGFQDCRGQNVLGEGFFTASVTEEVVVTIAGPGAVGVTAATVEAMADGSVCSEWTVDGESCYGKS